MQGSLLVTYIFDGYWRKVYTKNLFISEVLSVGFDMSIIGNVVLFFLAGFAQFNYMENKGGFAAVLFLSVLIGGVYFLGWWAILTFVVGAMIGSKVCYEYRHKSTE